MRRFVFWTGIISVLAGIGFQFPRFSMLLMPSERPGMLLHLFGLVAAFLGVMLIFCSRDLNRRGNLVLWEGLLRLGGFAIMSGYGILGNAGISVAFDGLFDLIIGIISLVGLPRYLGVRFMDLLVER